MAALSTSCGGHIGYTCLSGFFQRFSKKQLLFCSLQTVSFSWWRKPFTTRGPILNPTKTENEFPSKGKPQIPGKTSHANNPTQRSQQEQKVFKVPLITLATPTGLNSGASVFSERLSSCGVPGATAVGTLDLAHPMHALLPKRVVKCKTSESANTT